MNKAEWEDLREEVCTFLAIGDEKGEPVLETMTRLLWLERHKNICLLQELAVLQQEASAASEAAPRATGKISNVLAWKPALRSGNSF